MVTGILLICLIQFSKRIIFYSQLLCIILFFIDLEFVTVPDETVKGTVSRDF
jgi:hypothetical protein